MSYSDRNRPYIDRLPECLIGSGQDQQAGVIGQQQSDLAKVDAAMQEAIKVLEDTCSLADVLLGHSPTLAGGSNQAQPPAPDAVFPRLGSLASDLMIASKRASNAIARINGAI